MFKSLRHKLLATVILITAICTITFMGVSYYEIQKAAINQMKNDGTTLISTVSREINKYKLQDSDSIYKVFSEVKKQSKDNISYISLVDTNLKMMISDEKNSLEGESVDTEASATESSSITSGDKNNITGAMEQGKVSGFIFKSPKGEQVYNISTPFYDGDKAVGTINIGISLQSMNNVIKSSVIQSLVLSLFVSILAVIIGLIISKSITGPITSMVGSLEEFSKGDFTISLEEKGKDEIGKLSRAINSSILILRSTIGGIKQVVLELNSVSSELISFGEVAATSTKDTSSSASDVFKAITEQNTHINEIYSKLESFGYTLDNVSLKVQSATLSSEKIKENADVGAEKLKILVESIDDVRRSYTNTNKEIEILSKDVYKIVDITGIINSVAEQTNLLALNAGIEAARAGEAGRGFSVVAEEIRKLAEQVMEASKDINKVINSVSENVTKVFESSTFITNKMGRQLSTIDETVNSFKIIMSEVNTTLPQVENACASIKDIVLEKEIIVEGVHSLKAISESVNSYAQSIHSASEEQAGNVNQLLDSAEGIGTAAEKLAGDVNRFKVG